MDDNTDEQDVTNFITITDYIGEINEGIAVLLSMKVLDKIYEIGYWFDREDNYMISADEKFLADFNISNVYEYKDYKRLVNYIHKIVLSNKEELFKEFLT